MKTKGSWIRRAVPLGLGLILLMVLGLWVLSQSSGSAVGPQALGLTDGMGTARQALESATEAANQWQADARLATVSAQWLAVSAQSSPHSEWSFQFYSPASQHIALIVVNGDSEARLVRTVLSPYALPELSVGQWRVDSDRAQQIWLENGGRGLIGSGRNVDLVMQLRVTDETQRLIWTVAGMIPGTRSAFTVGVDATTGELTEL